MTVRMSTFAYPWDLGRLGVERTLGRIAEGGFDALYLASTYHPIDALSPRDGRVRLFASGRGAVHFPARPARYGRIQPATSSPEIGAVWPAVVERAASLGVDVIPWTIVLYQPWIVDRYPDCARVLPSGDAIDAGVCPANDDVREYVATLCDDLVDQFGVGTIHLEGPAPASFDYGWLRPRVLVDVPKAARELLSLCFCASCRQRGAAAGLDVDRVQQLVNDGIAAELDIGPAAPSVGDPEVAAFAAVCVRASVELVEAVAGRVRTSAEVRLSGMAWTPFSSLLGERDDELFEELLRPFDQVIVPPRIGNHRARVAMASRASRGLELAVLLTPGSLGDLKGAAEIGAAEVALYNYGLLREADVQRLTAEIRGVFPR